MSSIKKRDDGKWRARYRDPAGREHAKHFTRKVDAQRWIDEETANLVTGRWIDPTARKTTVDEWCDRWLAGYGSRRASTVRQARVHLALIRSEFGPLPIGSVRPSMVRSWLALLREEGKAASYVYALHSLGQAAPWTIEREIRKARVKIDGLPEGFRFHDLRHYYASLLISSGGDVKVVQHRLRHASAKTTLDTYGHLWPEPTSQRGPRSSGRCPRVLRTPCGLAMS